MTDRFLNSEDTAWVLVILGVFISIVTVLLIFTTYFDRQNRHIVEMVKVGTSPLEARCAIGTCSTGDWILAAHKEAAK